MDAFLSKVADGAPVIVLLLLVCAYAVYKWPFLLLWNALQASIKRQDALHERTLDALNNNTAAMNGNTAALAALAASVGAMIAAVADE